MNITEDAEGVVNRLEPHGTNSTMFTYCCDTAICDDQSRCPSCGKKIIGADAETEHERRSIRWAFATAHWKK